MKEGDLILMGYTKHKANILAQICEYTNDNQFKFLVINGQWRGIFNNGTCVIPQELNYIEEDMELDYKLFINEPSTSTLLLMAVGANYNEILTQHNENSL